jgi:hypothetical protein
MFGLFSIQSQFFHIMEEALFHVYKSGNLVPGLPLTTDPLEYGIPTSTTNGGEDQKSPQSLLVRLSELDFWFNASRTRSPTSFHGTTMELR